MKTPHIRTELPGPKARLLLERDAPVTSPSYPRDDPFVISHGRGAEVWDVDGNRFLDFAAGIAVCATGHAHPQVVKAIKDAADKFLHISSDYWHEGSVRLAERLDELAPMGEPVMTFLAQSGTESVEGALKLARYVTGRPRFIGFLGGFHGRTMGSLAFTSSKYTQQKGFFPTMPGVTHVPYPNPYRPLFAGADQGAGGARLHRGRALPPQRAPERGRGVLVEPIQGEGGYLVPPDGFLTGLRELCDRHGILLIFDEVQSGRRPHREDVREPALGRGARHHDPRQGPRLRAAHRRGRREEAAHGEVVPRAPTATPSAATPSAAPPRSRRSSWSSGSTPRTPRRWATTSWPDCGSCRRATRRSATCAARA